MKEVAPPQLDEFSRAAIAQRDILVRTPLVAFSGLTKGDGNPDQIWIKPETLLPSGCYKVRGIHYAISRLSRMERERGVSTVSAGNTAKALAWSARRFGVPARSLMPDSAPATKIEAMRALGGEPVLVPVDEVFGFLREHRWEREPYAFIHPWINRDVMIGHGTMGLEILEQLPDVDTVFIPVGGGGLLGGVGSALRAARPGIRIVAVEPQGCPSLHEAIRAGGPVNVDCDTICDGVAVPYITDEMYPLLSELAEETMLVSDDAVRAAIRQLVASHHLVAEPSGALSLAAALQVPAERRGKTVCLLTGGSIDTAKLTTILSDQ